MLKRGTRDGVERAINVYKSVQTGYKSNVRIKGGESDQKYFANSQKNQRCSQIMCAKMGKVGQYRSTLLSGVASALQLSITVGGGSTLAVPLNFLTLE